MASEQAAVLVVVRPNGVDCQNAQGSKSGAWDSLLHCPLHSEGGRSTQPLRPALTDSRHRREGSGSEWSFIQQYQFHARAQNRTGCWGKLQVASMCPFRPGLHPSPPCFGLGRLTYLGSSRLQWSLASGWASPTEGPGRRLGRGRVGSGTSISGSLCGHLTYYDRHVCSQGGRFDIVLPSVASIMTPRFLP